MWGLTKVVALERFLKLDKKLLSNAKLHEVYSEFAKKIVELEHLEKVPEKQFESQNCNFLSHHLCVLDLEKYSKTFSTPFPNTLSRTIPYLNTSNRTLPHLNKMNRTIPYLNTLNRNIPYLKPLSRTIPYLLTLNRTLPYLNTLNRTIPYLNTLFRIDSHSTLGTQSISSITSSANQNGLLHHPSRQPIRIEHYLFPATIQIQCIPHPSRQPIRIEHYLTPELWARVEDPCRL